MRLFGDRFCWKSLLFQRVSTLSTSMRNGLPMFLSLLSRLILFVWDIPSFRTYNGAMSTSQTENIVAKLRYRWSFDWTFGHIGHPCIVGIETEDKTSDSRRLIDRTIWNDCLRWSNLSWVIHNLNSCNNSQYDGKEFDGQFMSGPEIYAKPI